MATGLKTRNGIVEQSRRDDGAASPHRSREMKLSSNAIPVTASAGTAVAGLQANSEPTADQIRCRAYCIYCARNGGPGDALGDWLSAERELREAAQRGADSAERKRELAPLPDGDPSC